MTTVACETANRVCKIVRTTPLYNTKFLRLAGEDLGLFAEIEVNIFNISNSLDWGRPERYTLSWHTMIWFHVNKLVLPDIQRCRFYSDPS